MTFSPDDAYLTPTTQSSYGDVVNVGGKCYIKTGRKHGNMTHYISNDEYLYIGEVIDGACVCESVSPHTEENEDSELNSDNYVYIAPDESIPNGAVIRYDGKCYVKTGEKGSMSRFIPSPESYNQTCEDCEASGS